MDKAFADQITSFGLMAFSICCDISEYSLFVFSKLEVSWVYFFITFQNLNQEIVSMCYIQSININSIFMYLEGINLFFNIFKLHLLENSIGQQIWWIFE